MVVFEQEYDLVHPEACHPSTLQRYEPCDGPRGAAINRAADEDNYEEDYWADHRDKRYDGLTGTITSLFVIDLVAVRTLIQALVFMKIEACDASETVVSAALAGEAGLEAEFALLQSFYLELD